MQRDHLDAVVQIFAKGAVVDHGAEVSVGGTHDADVGLQRLGAADALEFPILQHPEQFALQLQRQFADFVDEQRAGRRRLEFARGGLVGAGESALLVAKQFVFDQRLGQRRAVDLDEGPRPPGAVVVDGAGEELLARAALAGDEDRGVGPPGFFDDGVGRAHGLALADDLVETVGKMRPVR